MSWKPESQTLRARTDRYWRGRHVLYRCFDASGQLLYVGLSGQVPVRMRQHSRESAWWPEVARIRVQVFPTRPAVFRAELDAIRNERPVHNHRHGSDWVHPAHRAA